MGTKPISIGGGVFIEFWELSDGTVAGLFEDHGCKHGGRSAISFDVPGNEHVPAEGKWQLESLDPLTLSPSLQCRICNKHGFIRNGAWVEA